METCVYKNVTHYAFEMMDGYVILIVCLCVCVSKNCPILTFRLLAIHVCFKSSFMLTRLPNLCNHLQTHFLYNADAGRLLSSFKYRT